LALLGRPALAPLVSLSCGLLAVCCVLPWFVDAALCLGVLLSLVLYFYLFLVLWCISCSVNNNRALGVEQGNDGICLLAVNAGAHVSEPVAVRKRRAS
jgi:hypothetical protein